MNLKINKIRFGKRLMLFIVLPIILSIGIALIYYLNSHKAISFIIPDVSKISYINLNITDGNLLAKIDVIVINKRPYRMVIDSFVCVINLDGKILFREKIPLKMNLPRFTRDTINFPFHLNIDTIINLLKSVQTRDSAHLEATGYIVYSSFIGKTKLPFIKKIKIELPIPPEIKVLKVERKRYNILEKSLLAEVTVQITNLGKNIDIELHHIIYNLKIKNTLSCTDTLKKIVMIKPGSDEILVIPITIKLEHPFKTALMIINDNDRMRYQLNLKSYISEKSSDREMKLIPIEVDATGILELQK